MSEYGSGSTNLLNTDPVWIRIHNPAYKADFEEIKCFFSVQESGSDLLSSRIGIWSRTLFQVFCLGIEVPEKIFFNKYLTWKSIILICQCYIFRIRIRAKWSGPAGLVRMCYVVFSGAVSSIESMEGAVRTLGSKLVFPDTRTTILACCIIYFFRYSNINKIRF